MSDDSYIADVDQTYTNNFLMLISNLPKVTFNVQRANIPSVTLEPKDVPTPGAAAWLRVPGNRLTYDLLNVTFLVDHKLENYLEVLRWMVSLGAPEGTQQYEQGDSVDATLIATTGHLVPELRVIYRNVHPTSLGNLDFESTTTTQQSLICDLTFAYDMFVIESV